MKIDEYTELWKQALTKKLFTTKEQKRTLFSFWPNSKPYFTPTNPLSSKVFWAENGSKFVATSDLAKAKLTTTT